MIDRYTLPEMGALWSEETKFQKWLDVEIAVCEVHAEMGTIPRDALEQIKSRAKFSVARINEIEKTTDHDVIAFTTNLAESIGEASRFVHYGLTSSDVVDTANALLLRDACDILLKKIDVLLDVLKRRALEFKDTPQVGRTHGIHAEPTSFGLTFALWFDEMRRNQDRLKNARESVAVGKISGAVGAFAHISSLCRFVTGSAPKWVRRRRNSNRARKYRALCRTSVTRFFPNAFAVWPGSCGQTALWDLRM